jgi:predicted ATPase
MLQRLTLKGFRSIKDCDLELRPLNILIGAGKSNFINFFQLVQQMLESKLQWYTSKQGGPDTFLHFGRKTTEQIEAGLYFYHHEFGYYRYQFALEPTQDNRLMFAQENLWHEQLGNCGRFGIGHFETEIDKPGDHPKIYNYIVYSIKDWRSYHFHDTSETSKVKQIYNLNDNRYLRPDASNLAAFLYFLKEQHFAHYQRIVKTIQLVAPFFGDFYLHPTLESQEKIQLQWTEKGEDIPFKAHHLSDGTLRFICLATVLLQPKALQPTTILIDEPELGLHPYAIRILAALLRSTSQSKQIIVSTQSVDLLNEFDRGRY